MVFLRRQILTLIAGETGEECKGKWEVPKVGPRSTINIFKKKSIEADSGHGKDRPPQLCEMCIQLPTHLL